MPEGNTVWLTARALRNTLAGLALTHADLRVADLATTDLVGQRVVDVVPRGKHLLIRLEPASLTLHTHLRMDGRWRIHPAGYRVHDPRRSRPRRSSQYSRDGGGLARSRRRACADVR